MQVENVAFHIVRFEDVRTGVLWIAGMWEPSNKISPLAEEHVPEANCPSNLENTR